LARRENARTGSDHAGYLTADEVIAHLKLGPHPEGGYFRETFRDEPGHKGRAHSTAILYLLKAGEVSRWHRVDAAEMWHWYVGAPTVARDQARKRAP
jgi:predicted cupin superfamily sugar epimerase